MRTIILVLPAFLVTACMHTGGPGRVAADDAKTRLVFSYAADDAVAFGLGKNVPEADAFKVAAKLIPHPDAEPEEKFPPRPEAKLEDDVARACGGAVKSAALVGTALTFLIGKGVAFLVDQADKALQAEIAKYAAAYQAGADVQLYASGDKLALRHNCLRVTRMSVIDPAEKAKNPPPKPGLLMDFVARIELDPSHTEQTVPSVLKITPLRLYYATPAVKSDDGKYGVTAALDMEVFWRQDNRGFRQSDYPQIALLSETVDFNKKKDETEAARWRYKSFIHGDDGKPTPAKDWPYRIAPLPAWTSYGAVDYGGNFVRAKVSVAEAGNVPWLLEKSAELFSDNKDSIEEKLREAIIKAAGIE